MRTLEELMKLDFADMTGDELHWLRMQRLPMHSQTMQKLSQDRKSMIFSDVEALTREMLDKKIEHYRSRGWRAAGVYFVRTWKGANEDRREFSVTL